MDNNEAQAWLRGERCTINHVPQDPMATWGQRVAATDAAHTQQAYWVAKAHAGGLISAPMPASVPEGWQIVPVKPTAMMLSEMFSLDYLSQHRAYAAMLAAAPKPEDT